VSATDHERHLRELVHDLRVPIAALAAAVELLEQEDETCEAVRSSVDHLRGLLRWAEASYAPISQSRDATVIEVAECVQRAADGLLPVMRAKNVTFTIQGNGEVLGDPTAVSRIMMNLLGNAVRYAPEGSTVSVLLTLEGAHVCCSVNDHGPGFDQANMSHDGHGWGMGLRVSESLAKSMGGSLRVVPQHAGATIEVLLPKFTSQIG